MTRKSPARNTEAQATIALDGIRTAAREIRTMFPNAQRPALNTLMNTMTRELGLGQSYGHALSAATQQPGAEPAIPAHRAVHFEIHFTGPNWVRHLATMTSEVSSSSGRETYRGKPVHILRVLRLPVTGSVMDAASAAQTFVDTHPLLQRSDVKIRKITVIDTERFSRGDRDFDMGLRHTPDAIPFDPSFAQDMPAGYWTIAGALYYEIAKGPAVKALLTRLRKIGFQERDGVYDNHQGVRYYIPSVDQPAIVAIAIRHSELCADPIECLTRLDPADDPRKHIASELTRANREAIRGATLIGRVIFGLGIIPITFRLDPTRLINGRTVPDAGRPALLVDAGGAFSGLSLKDFSWKNRTPEMNAKILAIAGVKATETHGYTIKLRAGRPDGASPAIAG